MKTVKRSGPKARVNTDPRLWLSRGSRWKHVFEGWRFGVFISITAVAICLIVELIMLACAMTLNKAEGDKIGIGVLFTGDCQKVERITTFLAVPLNVM